MALDYASLSSGDQRARPARRARHGDLSPSAQALALVSGDSFLVARPESAVQPGPAARPDSGARGPTRLLKGRDCEGRGRGRQIRFSPYAAPGARLHPPRGPSPQRPPPAGCVMAARVSG